jgi:hypothetical protein
VDEKETLIYGSLAQNKAIDGSRILGRAKSERVELVAYD